MTVSDGSLAATATITIDLIDIDESVNQAPQISDQIFTLLENSPAGFEVGTVSAGDPNGDAIVFSLSGGENAFLIDANTGVITIEDSVLVDYEINIQFVLTVTASDGDLSSTATVIINVSDLDESVNTAPSVTDQTFMIAENSVNNLFIGTIDATDAESNRLTYAITAGNDLGGFSLAVETGVLIVADQDQLDFEINPNFALTVAVSDGEFISDLTVTINLTNVEEKVNQAPTIADQSFSIDENSAIGSIVGQISGDDPDGDKIIFSLVNVSQVFTINAASGEIIALNTEALDFEISRSFFLEVNATDGSLTSSAMITININDIDENVLSVEETIGFDIYPNPTVDWINVISSEEVDFIACYDLQGTKLISSFTKEIDVSHLKAGVYLLYVHQSSGLKASRFIKR